MLISLPGRGPVRVVRGTIVQATLRDEFGENAKVGRRAVVITRTEKLAENPEHFVVACITSSPEDPTHDKNVFVSGSGTARTPTGCPAPSWINSEWTWQLQPEQIEGVCGQLNARDLHKLINKVIALGKVPKAHPDDHDTGFIDL
ncbi:MAG: type II toxin-antitoxin system PemK/MazF family toxin [Planctomycetota bacterium]